MMTERRGVLAAEAAALAVLAVADAVVGLRTSHGHGGPTQPAVGVALAVLAVLRRRFPQRLGLLTGAAAGLSLAATAVAVVGRASGLTLLAQPSATESLALALLVGAACRRLPMSRLSLVIPVAAVAMTAAPLVRYGLTEVSALGGVAAALLWGGGLALGLTLRNTDAAAVARFEGVRVAERTMLARELHDLVAHHISGVIVRTQAARLRGERGLTAEGDVLADVEATAGEALSAMRSLVDMLRAGAAQLAAVPADLPSSVAEAIGGDTRVLLEMGPQVATLVVPPEVPATIHRLVLESLTNVRRHAASATQIRVQLRADGTELLLDVVNDGVPAARDPRAGNGIVGMAERARALGGSLHAGPEDGRCWRVAARLPLRREGTA